MEPLLKASALNGSTIRTAAPAGPPTTSLRGPGYPRLAYDFFQIVSADDGELAAFVSIDSMAVNQNLLHPGRNADQPWALRQLKLDRPMG